MYRNLGLRHLQTVDPVINNEKYASMLSKLETSFLQFAGLDAGSCPAVLHRDIEEIAKFCLKDAFVFYVGEDDTDLSFAPVVCYLISHKYRADILKKNIKSSSISLRAIFGGYHMAHDAMWATFSPVNWPILHLDIRTAPPFLTTPLFSISKPLYDSALLHDAICRMAGFDFVVDGKVDARNRTVPNIMVAFAMADKTASILAQDIPDLFLVLRHYADIPTLFSNWKFSLFAEGW